jgi:uncharacterized damage-inducible protein DinB
MNLQTHFLRQTDYQLWANQVLFAALARLEPEVLHQPQGLHSRSIAHTTEHVLLVSRLWAGRLRGAPEEVDLKAFTHSDWSQLKHALQHELRSFRHWLEVQPAGFFDERVAYPRTGGEICHCSVADVLAHLMNNFTHHRAQIAAVATRLGAPVAAMDYIYFTRDMERAEREAEALRA